MKPAAHQYEDKLLELAYGELPAHEASAVESHVRTCARCSEALSEIRAVRSTMGQLPMEPVPETGLESLFAYADQAARRNAAGPAPAATWWRRFMGPLVAAGALSLVGIFALQMNKSGDVIAKRSEIAEGAAREQAVTAAPPPAPAAPAPANEVAAAPEPVLYDKDMKKQAEPAVWTPEQAKAEADRERKANDVVAAKVAAPAKPAPAKKGAGAELEDGLKVAQKLSASKNKADEAPMQKEAAANYYDPRSDKSGKDVPFGVSAGSSQRAAAPPAEEQRQPPPPPPQLAQQQAYPAEPPSRTSMGVSMNSRPVAGQSGSLGERDEAEKTRRGDAPAAAVAPQQMVQNFKSQIDQLRAAQANRDTETEINIGRQILNHNAKGSEKLEALNAVCTGLTTLGRLEEAYPFCEQMLREFPDTRPAQNYRNNQMRQRPAPAKRAKSEQSYDDEAKAAPPAPVESKPAAAESAK